MAVGLWIGVLANAVIATAYLAVALLLGVSALRSNQWRTNPLGLGTVLLYVTCGGGHAMHALQLFEAARGAGIGAALGSAIEYDEWEMWAWDVLTAAIGVWYWTQRKRFPQLVTGAAVFEDLRLRQKRALEINDNLVQGLARAKMSYELGHDVEGQKALDETLLAGQRIVEELAHPARKEAS